MKAGTRVAEGQLLFFIFCKYAELEYFLPTVSPLAFFSESQTFTPLVFVDLVVFILSQRTSKSLSKLNRGVAGIIEISTLRDLHPFSMNV